MNIIQRIERHYHMYSREGLEPEPMAITTRERDEISKKIAPVMVGWLDCNWTELTFHGVRLHVIQEQKTFKEMALEKLKKEYPYHENMLERVIDILDELIPLYYKDNSQ